MPAAAAATKAADIPPSDDIALPARGKKKLLILISITLVIVLVLAGGAIWFLKHRAAADAATDEDGQPVAQTAAQKERPHAPPIFVPLEPFVVNLADKDVERYAQIGLTLELDDPKVAEEMKVYMPAIRDAILMILAHKTSTELLDRAGKEALAAEIMRESVRPMGLEIGPAVGRDGKPIKPVPPPVDNPVRRVLFSSFIVQ
ncbi:MAG: flagellar basal body-associated FliL family protein [Burkholderiales bacterium]